MNLAMFVAFQTSCILPHELAHAVTAAIVGMRPYQICIGCSGRTVWKVRALGCMVEFRSVPIGGFIQMTPRSLLLVRMRTMLVLAAGPLSHVGLAALPFLASESIPDEFVQRWGPLWIGTNVIMFGLTLFPFQFDQGRSASDGWQLMTAPFMRRETIRAWHAQHFLMQGVDRWRRDDFDAARECFERGLSRYPGNFELRYSLAAVLPHLGEFEQARTIFCELLA